eukprot:SAG31_NODE_836_length_11643_cov_3.389813_11_plen_89_part_00
MGALFVLFFGGPALDHRKIKHVPSQCIVRVQNQPAAHCELSTHAIDSAAIKIPVATTSCSSTTSQLPARYAIFAKLVASSERQIVEVA